MHARTVRMEGSQEAFDRTKEVIEEQIIPVIRQLPGFQGAYWAGDRSAGKGLAVFFYSDADKLMEAAERARQMRDSSTQAAGGSITSVKEHEVIASTGEKVHSGATHMRVTSLRSDPSRKADGIAQVEGTVIPNAKKMAGFMGGFWLMTLDGREVLACTLWAGRESLEASRSPAGQLRRGAADATGTDVLGVEEFEIVARATTPG